MNKLKLELVNKEKEYKQIVRQSRGVSSFDTLVERKDSTKSFTEFDFRVMKKKYEEAKKRYEELYSQKGKSCS